MKNCKKDWTKGLAVVATIAATGMAVAGCGSSNTSASTTKGGKFQGTITMYAGTYGPPDTQNQVKGVSLIPATELKKLAAEYEKSHPGIKINFIHALPAGQDYDTWVRTKAAGGQLPDIIWEQWYYANTALPKGTLLDLSSYLNKPDPYVTGKNWGDVLNKQIMSETKSPDGGTYIINGDYVGQGVYYNKDAFAKAGITKLPTRWSEFIEDCKKLKAAGYIPFAWDSASTPTGIDRLTWLSRLFYTNFYANQWDELRYTGNAAITDEDQVIAIKKGVIGPKSKKWMAMWPLIKEFSKYWKPDFTGGDSNGNGPMLAFLTGKVGMYFDGSWAARQIDSAKSKFRWGTFPDPYPDKATSPYATNFNSSPAVGGPSSAFQYGIASPKADNTMTPAKEKACVDWLEYITTPQHDQAIVNQLGEFIPTVVGTKPVASLKNLADLVNQPLESVFGGINLTADEQNAIFRAYQSYILGQTSLADFAQVAGQQMDKAANDLISRNNWDLSKYLK
ncbi:ABC transporter substrate-binding protein [Alicyclobacillus herbarius]|uniref:ABC transporter substrate-binding protein n=1 Tax=Alicyclobacillus herbarius TaxID=122960 RepID=UPI00041D9101|nr:extracellular solute-binding protein [Alicyclobacillus herbarius]